MKAIRKLIGRSEKAATDDLLLPQPVERAYVLSKDAGHRGPVIGGYIVTGFENIELALTVTPSGVTVVAADTGNVLTIFHPKENDAFTSSCLLPLSSEAGERRLCGLAIGTQAGLIVVIEVASEVREIACCEASKSSITALILAGPNVIIAGNICGQIFVYDPVNHPETPCASLSVFPESEAAVTALCPLSETILWAAVDGQGIAELSLRDLGAGLVSIERPELSAAIHFEGMQSITDMVVSHRQKVVICVSSCSDVFLVDMDSHSLVQQYPANLMTCGSALAVVAAAEPADTGDSTFLFLGGVDGSLAIRELNRRKRDGKLQCVLHRCVYRLCPQTKDDLSQVVNPSEGCPISSLWVTESSDHCVAGDAACSLYLVPLILKISRASTPSLQGDELRQSIDEGTEISDNLGM